MFLNKGQTNNSTVKHSWGAMCVSAYFLCSNNRILSNSCQWKLTIFLDYIQNGGVYLIYDEIKRVARDKGISVYRIERDLKISNGTLSKWNNASPSAIVLKKVADYLEVDMNELLEDRQVNY